MASDRILWDKESNIAKNKKYDGYWGALASVVFKRLDKNAFGSNVKNENILNTELAEELHKLIIRKCEKRKVQLLFIDNIWGADLAYIQVISKFNEGIRF